MMDSVARLSCFAEFPLRFERVATTPGFVAAILVYLIALVVVWRLYRRMSSEITRRKRLFLVACRITAITGVMLFYLSPVFVEWRDRGTVLVLVDTSGSMGIADSSPKRTRMDVIRSFLLTGLDDAFAKRRHELVCATFDTSLSDSTLVARDDRAPGETFARWLAACGTDGASTCLTDSLAEAIRRNRDGAPVAVVLCTDGAANVGMPPAQLVRRLRECPCPVHVVASGVTAPAFDFTVTALRAPESGTPNADLPVHVTLTGRGKPEDAQDGAKSETLDFYLVEESASERRDSAESLAERLNETAPVDSLAIVPREGVTTIDRGIRAVKTGTFLLAARLRSDRGKPAARPIPFVRVEIDRRRNRVLLIAGGPSRDFEFLESELKRDGETDADVCLVYSKRFYTLAAPGTGEKTDPPPALENGRITARFLDRYDAVVAFDPDWKNAFSAEEIAALESWVARDGGGLVLAAGPVFAGNRLDGWTLDENAKTIRGLYPIHFFGEDARRRSGFESGRNERRVRFDSADELKTIFAFGDGTDDVWTRFPGFCSVMPVESVKPTARRLATLDGDDDSRVLFATQLYGAGRVFYIGNVELWRLRTVEERAFYRLFSNIVQYTLAGRRLRRSPYGRLAVEPETCTPGARVDVQAVLNDLAREPLVMERATLDVVAPDGTKTTTSLLPRKELPGLYRGDVELFSKGVWKFELPIPGTNAVLTDSVHVEESDLERPPSYRDDELLNEIAKTTGGQLVVEPSTTTLARLLDSIVYSREPRVVPERQYPARAALLMFICLCLFVEWISRRLTGLV